VCGKARFDHTPLTHPPHMQSMWKEKMWVEAISHGVICSCFHYFNLLQHMPQFYEQALEMEEVSMDSFYKKIRCN